MQNTLKSKIFYNFIKRSYNQVAKVEEKEEVFYKDGKLVVVVKDEEIGKQLYDIIKTLKDRNEEIFTQKMSFIVDKYIADKQNIVNIFCLKVDKIQKFLFDSDLEIEWKEMTKIQRLQELVTFIEDMQNKGYIVDESRFKNETCNCISDFLSFFVTNNGEINNSKGYIVKYIHYFLSNGGNLDEFYGKVVNENIICSISEFPYALPVIKMCYDYFVSGVVPVNIYEILQKEKFEKILDSYDYLIVSDISFGTKLILTEESNEYKIYDGVMKIKIYHNIDSKFEEALKNRKDFINNNETIEQIDNLIIDFNGNIIGYKPSIKEIEESYAVLDKDFENQNEILDFITKITRYLLNVIYKFNFVTIEGNCEFNIEKDIVVKDENYTEIKIKTIKQLFNLVTDDKNMLKSQITKIFFKILLKYITQKYGELSDEEQFLEKEEIRYLSPIVAREFINYALERQVDYNLATNEFFKFIVQNRVNISDICSADTRFKYNLKNTPFIFDYEAEKKYGIKINSDINEQLSDGRRLITFKRKKKISTIKKKEDSLKSEIIEKLGNIQDEYVNISEISEIIYSKSLNSENMYKVVGYITTPIKGKLLTDEELLNLNNKDLLKVLGSIFSKFGKYYIPWENIWMDNDFKFYINILDENFQINRSRYGIDSKREFMDWIISYLIDKGYNSNAFIEINGHYIDEWLLLNLSNSYDSYCDEHDIYYNSKNKMCPVCLRSRYLVPQDFEKTSNIIFEDLYAKHYNIDENYNLKVYKNACVDIAKLEKNVDKIISRRLISKAQKLGQDCFIPYKKAINDKGKFIGYIYERVEFNSNKEGGMINLKDSENLRNLARLKSLIRLILQVKEITQENLEFIENPYSNVFLSKSHRNQVQILNVEFLSSEGSEEDTIKWTKQYICDIINSDNSIEVDSFSKFRSLDTILEELQKVTKDMTKFCSFHKIYYRSEYLFCPKCVKKEKLKDIKVEYVEPSTITEQNVYGEGGEAIVYDYKEGSVAKVFTEGEIDYSFKSTIISRIINKKNVLEKINNQNHKYKYIIPKKILIDINKNNIFAYTMEKVEGKPLSILRDKDEIEKMGITMQDVLEILITVSKGIETLHTKANMYIGDLNGQNILFDSDKNVYFLDFDGMGIDEISPRCFTEEYIDPISSKNQKITMKDDWYSFAIQAFHYLTFTHPFNGLYYVVENGNKRNLTITERMERRISLLGDYGIKPPAVTKSWDWMNKELKTAFLRIFEGDDRYSITQYLINQYDVLYKKVSNNNSIKNIQINSQFIATNINPFDSDIVHIVNHYSAICCKEDEYYVSIIVNDNLQNTQYKINLPEYMKIKDILLSENLDIAFAVYGNKIIAIDLKANTEIYREEISDIDQVIVNDNTLYFTEGSDSENIIFQRCLSSEGGVKKEKIRFLKEQKTKHFLVKFNSKFVIVKHSSDNVDEIYCNSEKLCDINCKSDSSKYNIIYDDITKLWLVINSEGNGIVIDMKGGRYKEFNIEENLNDVNLDNIEFYKRNIYIPNQDYLDIVNISDQLTTKKMECHKIMTPDSKLYNFNSEGFCVINNNILYEVRRG